MVIINYNEKRISVGPALSGYCIDIVTDCLDKCDETEVGRVMISGEGVSNGYVGIIDESFIDQNNKRSFLTEDLGFIQNGALTIVGRTTKQFKIRGLRINPEEVESQIKYILNIFECKIFLFENDSFNQLVMFYAGKEMTYKEIRLRLKSKLLEYEIPRIIIHTEGGLINSNGKSFSNSDFRDYLEQYTSKILLSIKGDVKRKVFEKWLLCGGSADVLWTDNVLDYFDSLTSLLFISELEKEFSGIRFNMDVLLNKNTLNKLVRYICSESSK